MPPYGISWLDELVEGLGRPLSVRGSKNLKALENSCPVSENEAIKMAGTKS